MKLAIDKIICSCCKKEHPTSDFELIPMMGFNWANIKKNKVYMHDVGALQVSCECGYTTTLDRR